MEILVNTGTPEAFINNIISLATQRKSSYVCVANVHMLVEAHKDPNFANVVNNADITTPDGVPLTWAIRLIHKTKQKRVAGMDLLPALLEKAGSLSLPIFFYGGTEEMLIKTKDYLKKVYSEINIAGSYSPPFNRTNTKQEEDEIILQINESGAAIIFVVLGCPKQERWMQTMQGKINAVMVGIGGALPVLIGMQQRAPVLMQKLGLEWLFRLLQEPKRLFKRYSITNSVFLYLLVKELLMAKNKRLKFLH